MKLYNDNLRERVIGRVIQNTDKNRERFLQNLKTILTKHSIIINDPIKPKIPHEANSLINNIKVNSETLHEESRSPAPQKSKHIEEKNSPCEEHKAEDHQKYNESNLVSSPDNLFMTKILTDQPSHHLRRVSLSKKRASDYNISKRNIQHPNHYQGKADKKNAVSRREKLASWDAPRTEFCSIEVYSPAKF